MSGVPNERLQAEAAFRDWYEHHAHWTTATELAWLAFEGGMDYQRAALASQESE
jgi:hypothetical protein